MSTRPPNGYTESELQRLDARDLVTTFVAVQARQWQRRAVNRILPKLEAELAAAQLKGDQPDMPALLKQVWLNERIDTLLLESRE